MTYVMDVLTNGYKFDDDSFDSIEFVESVDGEEVAWNLGFIVNKSNELEPNETSEGERKISGTVFGVLLAFGIVLILLCSVAIFFFHRSHYNRELNRTPKNEGKA